MPVAYGVGYFRQLGLTLHGFPVRLEIRLLRPWRDQPQNGSTAAWWTSGFICVRTASPRSDGAQCRCLHIRALAHEIRQRDVVDFPGAEQRQFFEDQHL